MEVKTAQSIWDGEMSTLARQNLLTEMGIPLVAAKQCAEKSLGNFGAFGHIRKRVLLCFKFDELKAANYFAAVEDLVQHSDDGL